jgi:alpha-amylase/alpha-mannosidase (GH57 family)
VSHRVALLWHLHQPDYRDPETGVPVMPWTRLHALRGYRDVLRETAAAGVRVTVNLVPSLLDQLLHYAAGGADGHLELTRIPAGDLDDAERLAIRDTFFGGHPDLRRTHTSYAALEDRFEAGDVGVGDWRDLQVWSTLAWFGATALDDFPAIAALRAKGRGFTEDDKDALLDVQASLLAGIPDDLRALATSNAEIAASPYFHPILPLLVDTRHAFRALPEVRGARPFVRPADALRQLRDARARVEALTGRAPTTLWPSEGSVSPEVVELAAQAGFRALCSDDGVLARSERTRATANGGWDLGHGVTGLFRDHELSDRVGFRYAKAPADVAVADLLDGVRRRAPGVVLLALDGENPWEAWPGAGREFRRRWYDALRDGPIRGVTVADAAREPVVGRVTRLHTGSWIGADLRVWYGDAQDRAAWALLSDAAAAVDAAPPERRAEAQERLLPAEGSDWMWWYGPEFSTPFAKTFDALFRAHLRAVWRAAGLPAPANLDEPVGASPSGTSPTGPVEGSLDHPPSVVGWAGAGDAPVRRGGSMAQGSLDRVRFGVDRDGVRWLRVDLPDAADAALAVEVAGEVTRLDGRRASRGALAWARFDGVVVVRLGSPPTATVIRLDAGAIAAHTTAQWADRASDWWV